MNRVGKVSIAIPLVEDVRTSNKKSSMDGLGLPLERGCQFRIRSRFKGLVTRKKNENA
jgi:hypothetical protein